MIDIPFCDRLFLNVYRGHRCRKLLARSRAAVGVVLTVCLPVACRAHASGHSSASPSRDIDVVVDRSYAGTDGGRIDGVPTYRSIGAAIAAAPSSGDVRYVVRIRPGRYYEKLSVDKPNARFVGDDRDRTVLTYDASAGTPTAAGGTLGTRNSFTLRIAAPRFSLEHMTVENGFDFNGNAAKRDDDPTKVRGTQAVAILLDRGSDEAAFRDCRISGYQDTLFPNAGRSYFNHCVIAGTVDFIFGAGRAVFDSTIIVSRDRMSPTNNGYITAPSTPVAQAYGFVFIDSRLEKERPSMAPHSVSLGRPWHPSGDPKAIGSSVFIRCWMDDHISALGWSPMSGFRAEDARFFEYGSTGPGAIASPTRRVLSAAEASRYTVARLLDGWTP